LSHSPSLTEMIFVSCLALFVSNLHNESAIHERRPGALIFFAMTKLKARHLFLFVIAAAAVGLGVMILQRHFSIRHSFDHPPEVGNAFAMRTPDPDLWTRSMDKLKETRAETENVGIEIPAQLRHYDDRRWFLGTQVAEVRKFNLQPVQDYIDLAAMIRRGELVPLPAVTDTYILYGVAARVDGEAFTRYVANQNLELNDEAGLRNAYDELETEHAELIKEIKDLQEQLLARGRSGANADDLQIDVETRRQELRSNLDDKALLDRYYGQSNTSPRLWRDYDSLQELAKSFGGRSFNLDDSSDRHALKLYMLSSLRPQALKVLEEVAKSYHDKFDRPLPVSSLIRPEQYQHALRRVNRYAVLIDTPPHSTGLAFDIDYRFMSGAEQNFLMNELARMKDEGRIEVLRERGANYHVFAFIDGQRPGDQLITASLIEAGSPVKQAAHAEKTPAKSKTKSRSAKKKRH